MEIVLARHGRPKLGQKRWIAPRQLADWIRAYDEGGVIVEQVPGGIGATALLCGCIVTSPLPRCVQSAQALAPMRAIRTEEMLREAGLPHGLWRFPRLPVAMWVVVFRAAWFCGYSSNSESLRSARSRARSAAKKLVELAQEQQSVFAMGHGIMTALIAKELILQGWEGPKRPAHAHWQLSAYRRSEAG
jgi:broad specificity phosphatase PhoE